MRLTTLVLIAAPIFMGLGIWAGLHYLRLRRPAASHAEHPDHRRVVQLATGTAAALVLPGLAIRILATADTTRAVGLLFVLLGAAVFALVCFIGMRGLSNDQ
jgi:hypothetical protein